MKLVRSNTLSLNNKKPGHLMSRLIIFCLLSTLLTLFCYSHFSYAEEGGATSGGGDEDGIDAQHVLRIVTDFIKLDDFSIYSAEQKKLLLTKSSLANIIMVDKEIPVNTSVGIQESAGFSRSNKNKDENVNVIQINRKRWLGMRTIVDNEVFIHHELAVLAGIEKTGDYHISDTQFRKFRSILWEKLFSKKIVCVVSLFSKEIDTQSGKFQPHHLVGSAGIVVNSSIDVISDWRIVKMNSKDENKNTAVIFRYVASGNGYLRGVFSDATILGNPGHTFFSEIKNESKPRVFFTPYNLLEIDREASLKEWDDYFNIVSCSKM